MENTTKPPTQDELNKFQSALIAALARCNSAEVSKLCAESSEVARAAFAFEKGAWLDPLLMTSHYLRQYVIFGETDFFAMPRETFESKLSVIVDTLDVLVKAGWRPSRDISKKWLSCALSGHTSAKMIKWLLSRGDLTAKSAHEMGQKLYRADGLLQTIQLLGSVDSELLSKLRAAGFCSGPWVICGVSEFAAYGLFDWADELIKMGGKPENVGSAVKHMDDSSGRGPLEAYVECCDFGVFDPYRISRGLSAGESDESKVLSGFLSGLERMKAWGVLADKADSASSLGSLLRFNASTAMMDAAAPALISMGANPNGGDGLAKQIALIFRMDLGHGYFNEVRADQAMQWAMGHGFDPSQHSAVFIAEICSNLNDDRIEQLMKVFEAYGIDPKKVGKSGPSPLKVCLEWKHRGFAMKLIEEGMPVDGVDNDGESLLHYLAGKTSKANEDVFKMLMARPEMKALVNLKSKAKAGAGQTALHRACGALNIKAMKLLLAEGALINDRDAKGWTPMRHALRKYGPKAHGKIEPVIRLLIDAGADVGLADNEGRSPAQSAAARAPLEGLGILLGMRPEDVSEDNGASKRAREKLEQRGAQGKSLSEKAQMTAVAGVDATLKMNKAKSKSI